MARRGQTFPEVLHAALGTYFNFSNSRDFEMWHVFCLSIAHGALAGIIDLHIGQWWRDLAEQDMIQLTLFHADMLNRALTGE